MNEQLPLLTIWCPTYNHEKYIRKCIEGFLSQKTNFDIEIIIHDDASQDQTAQIIREYEANFNHLRGIYQSENQLSKNRSYLTQRLVKEARGKYIAICEGDDFWTDENKLQKQVDFLEKELDVTIVGHSIRVIRNSGDSETWELKNEYITFEAYIQKMKLFTTSIVFRNILKEIPDDFSKYPAVDFYIKLLLLNQGKGYVMKDVMAAYRVHEKGFWSSQRLIQVHQNVMKGYRLSQTSFPKKKNVIAFAAVDYKLKNKLFWKLRDRFFIQDVRILLKKFFKKITQ